MPKTQKQTKGRKKRNSKEREIGQEAEKKKNGLKTVIIVEAAFKQQA